MDCKRTGSLDGLTRRGFLGTAAGGLLGGLSALSLPQWARAEAGGAAAPSSGPAGEAGTERPRLSLVHGDSRAANILEALKRIEPEIRKGLARKKRVLIKPNVVSTTNQLAATHAECLEAILDFFSPMVRDEIVIADSTASQPAAEGFDHYGYFRLEKKYKVRLLDLDMQPNTMRHVLDARYRPQAVRFSQLLLDPDTYLISAAVPKTHDRAVVTLSLKNVTVGGLGKDPSFRWQPGTKARSDKWLAHGGKNNEAMNYNLFLLAQIVRPDLSVIDGFTGMEGNGPVGGTAVDHRVAIASTDWLAADRVAVELMGFDFAKVGYLSFCAAAGMGQSDLSRIEILGGKVTDHIRKYRPHDTVEQQYKWMEG